MLRWIVIIGCLLGLSMPSSANTLRKYASIVVDADTLEVIHARQIDGQRFPASLTKVMTLYLTFDAINAGTLSLNEPLPVSKNAARTPPVDIGLRAGETITVEQAIYALTVRSANDVAVVLAERLAGSEEAFAAQMTAKARALRMQRTVFKTPHGLPHPDQTTTARDMAKLASAMLSHHQRYYHYFGQKNFTWKNRTYKNTNSLLHRVNGVDGFKTGFTNDSGYNLIISAKRDGRRVIAVVLGGASGKSRDRHMEDLVERSFDVIKKSPLPVRAPVMVSTSPSPKIEPIAASLPTAVRLRTQGEEHVLVVSGQTDMEIAGRSYDHGWSLQVGAFATEQSAQAHLESLSMTARYGLSGKTRQVIPVRVGNNTFYRARFTAMTASEAQATCKVVLNGCQVIAP